MDKIFYIFNFEDRTWLFLDSFIAYLRKNLQENDRLKEIKYSNITKQLKSFSHSLQYIDGKTAVPLVSVLRYIFFNTDTLKSCKDLAERLAQQLYKPSNYHKSILEFYKEIETTEISFSEILENVTVEESIPSLFCDYKEHFSVNSWKKICIFEKNFSSRNKDKDLTFEETVEQRWLFLQTIKDCQEIGQTLVKESCDVIKNREIRYESASLSKSIHLRAVNLHIASKIEEDILSSIEITFPGVAQAIACVDTEKSKSFNDLIVFLELKDENEYIPPDIANVIEIELSKIHNVHCAKVICVKPIAFERHTENDKIGRFSLRDSFLKKKLSNDTVCILQHSVYSCDQPYHNEDGQILCNACHPKNLIHKPLDIDSFDVLNEWVCDVPLIVQVLLEPFINRNTLRFVGDRRSFLMSKIERLYSIYDNLLNLHNKKYTGVIQKANTEELLMGYKSIGTVFKITSRAGVTKSLTASERDLIQTSRPDDCYYSAYLKQYPMYHQSAAGTFVKQVRMRDCHIILMLDNLVRLKFKDDPDPGESRSKQMCTLPITLQGLPKDHTETESWHDYRICDGTVACPCKRAIAVNTNDITPALLQLSPEEQSALTKFRTLCTWGNSLIWQAAKENDIWNQICRERLKATTWFEQEIGIEGTSQRLMYDIVFEQENETPSEDVDTNESLHALLEAAEAESGNILEELTVGSDFGDDILNHLIDDMTGIANTTTDELNDMEMSRIAELHESDLRDGNQPILQPMQNQLVYEEHQHDIPELEKSLKEIILDDSPSYAEDHMEIISKQEPLPVQVGFSKYSPPDLLYLHPMPYEGKDDDITKLKEVLDDVITKLGYYDQNTEDCDKIIFGPDNKIGSNLIKLIRQNKRYEIFLPEFPCLHMRKSKINNIFSAYKDCGLIQMLQFMKDDDTKEWSKLLTSDHIEIATKNVRRLAQSLHILFLVKFMSFLPEMESEELLAELQNESLDFLAGKWDRKYQGFIDKSCKANATFALHYEMMDQLDTVLGISLAERLGGKDGYNLLLAVAKEGITFGFLNGAVSYAPYCVQLVYEHYRVGPFYKCMKQSLFSTPLKNSKVNFATDTKRELDHIDVVKGFRSGSTMTTVMRRMSVIDNLNSVQKMRDSHSMNLTGSASEKEDNLGWNTTNVDLKHILPLVGLLLRRSHLSGEAELYPCNMYLAKKTVLPQYILNENCKDVGKFMIMKYLVNEGLFGCTRDDLPNTNSVDGPKQLVDKVKRSKGVTVKRASVHMKTLQKTERECKEEKRKKVVAKHVKQANCLSSEMNMVQAFVKPDCSKPKVQKARGMVTALGELLLGFPPKVTFDELMRCVADKNIILSGLRCIPSGIGEEIGFVSMEFAGVKFKTKAMSGYEYLKQIESTLIKSTVQQCPKVKRLVICEEKYSFTPDTFKAATRNQRISKKPSISHLKTGKDMISASKFHKDSLITTQEGKSLASTFLAANASKLDIKKELVLDIDSELEVRGCCCPNEGVTKTCTCQKYTAPIRLYFDENGFKRSEVLEHIKQRKGEAEMAQVDWLLGYSNSIKEGEAVSSVVTSGDIDAVVIHLYAISQLWPRSDNGKFKNTVYVILQKPMRKIDIFNITAILEYLESTYDSREIGKIVALSLCLGGNDFIPKMYGVSHGSFLKVIVMNEKFRQSLFVNSEKCDVIATDVLMDLVKKLYCPKNKDYEQLGYDEVRQLTINKKRSKRDDTADVMNSNYRNPQQWMPPEGAIKAFAELVNLQIEYLHTVGSPDACLPNFLSKNCLKRTSTGEIEYDFGADSFMPTPEIFLSPITSTPVKGKKRLSVETPQKGQRRKALLTSTPR